MQVFVFISNYLRLKIASLGNIVSQHNHCPTHPNLPVNYVIFYEKA